MAFLFKTIAAYFRLNDIGTRVITWVNPRMATKHEYFNQSGNCWSKVVFHPEGGHTSTYYNSAGKVTNQIECIFENNHFTYHERILFH